MEEKKSVVKEASYYTVDGAKKQDNFGNYSLKIVFENGDSGWFSTKYDTNSAFKVGTEVA